MDMSKEIPHIMMFTVFTEPSYLEYSGCHRCFTGEKITRI
jgi:hypothetical protein